jgi:hypothetical protein
MFYMFEVRLIQHAILLFTEVYYLLLSTHIVQARTISLLILSRNKEREVPCYVLRPLSSFLIKLTELVSQPERK